MIPDFNAEKHEYRHGGHIYPSVTQILSDLGFTGSAYYTPESAQRGTDVHLATAYDDQGRLDWGTVDPIIRPYVEAWRAWREASLMGEPRHIEHRLVSTAMQYAGTIDRAWTVPGKTTVVDIKTGAPERWHRLQLAAYAQLLELPADEVADGILVYLSNDGRAKATAVNVVDMVPLRMTWDACLRVYHSKKGMKGNV